MVSRVIPVEPFDLVIFGGTGDLAKRKILPGLYRRFLACQIPVDARIVAAARTDLDDAAYREMVRPAIEAGLRQGDEGGTALEAFLDRVSYVAVDAQGEDGWSALCACMRDDAVRTFYLSVAPALFAPLADRLHRHGLARRGSRLVLEKPFGHDLESARQLNRTLSEHFDEGQIYRIDHYLGKETVQNLMAVRFGNVLFEPLWNSQFVDHIQITVAESVGVGGRGEYYDRAGAMRDMVQNHLMQLLCLIAMEPPSRYQPDAVRDEKLKVIRALEAPAPRDIVRGQYAAGADTASYREDVGDARSRTECFVALKLHVSNWRWAGTPFYLRTGKRLRGRQSEIAIVFKDAPHSIFGDTERHANALIIRLQPNEGITLCVTIKEPGPGGMRLTEVPLDMSFAETLGPEAGNFPDAYERLVMDVIRGDQTLFMRGDEVEAAWSWTDPVIAAWEARGDTPKPYEPGSAGPEDAAVMMHREGRKWREIRP